MYAEPVPTICRKYIEIRYRLIQYIYDAMYENTLCGKPICRPLFMDEVKPGDEISPNENVFIIPNIMGNKLLLNFGAKFHM